MEDTLRQELESCPLTHEEVGDPSDSFAFNEATEGEGINAHQTLVLNWNPQRLVQTVVARMIFLCGNWLPQLPQGNAHWLHMPQLCKATCSHYSRRSEPN